MPKINDIIATASNAYSTYTADKMVDGDITTGWTTALENQSALFDLQKEYTVGKVRFYNGFDNVVTASGNIYYSTNGIDYQLYSSFANYNIADWYELNKEITARYFKFSDLVLADGKQKIYVRLSEVEFYTIASSAILKNPSTNQYYSLADKTLILLPDRSDETIIEHGIEEGKEIQLDEAFDKIIYHVEESAFKTTVKPLSIKVE